MWDQFLSRVAIGPQATQEKKEHNNDREPHSVRSFFELEFFKSANYTYT